MNLVPISHLPQLSTEISSSSEFRLDSASAGVLAAGGLVLVTSAAYCKLKKLHRQAVAASELISSSGLLISRRGKDEEEKTEGRGKKDEEEEGREPPDRCVQLLITESLEEGVLIPMSDSPATSSAALSDTQVVLLLYLYFL